MSTVHVLLLHGFNGPGPWHWQRWLAAQLTEEPGARVELPRLPDWQRPRLCSWLPVLRERLAAVPEDAELVVAAHCAGAALWLHHAASTGDDVRRADRVLLAAPPTPDLTDERLADVLPYPLDARSLRNAGGPTRLVAGTDDPWLPMQDAHELADALEVDLDIVADGRRLDTEPGYGPWPAALRWALYGSVPLADRFDGAPCTASHSLSTLRLV